MDNNTVLNRLFALRRWMNENAVEAFVLRDVTNIAWLTGFEEVFDSERAHTLVVTGEAALLHSDSRYSAALRAAAAAGGNLFAIDDTPAMSASGFAASVLGENAPAFAIEDDISLAEFRALEAAIPGPAPIETRGVVKALRGVKTPAELERLQRAQDITDAAFAHIQTIVRPGMTEREIQVELDDFMYRAGAPALAFTSIVAAGSNSTKPHAVPGDTRLEAGQILLLDFGATYKGYCADMTRCLFLGEPASGTRHIYEVVVSVNEAVQRALKPGVTGAEMHNLAEDLIAQAGFGGLMGHGLGHGVGMEVHEEPNLNRRNTHPLVPGNVVTVEPGIYLPEGWQPPKTLAAQGSPAPNATSTSPATPATPFLESLNFVTEGVRIEDFGVITADGFRVFTKTPHDIVIL